MTSNTPEQIKAFEEALVHPNYAYARARSWRLSGYVKDNTDYVVYVYHNNPESPTGVNLSAALSGLDEATEIMDRLGKPFPLSPTEGLRRS